MSKKRILLSGYFGFDNAGDEAILEAECAQLRRLCPDVELSALIDNKKRAEELGLIAYKRKSLFQVYKAVSAADLVISGGGGLFQDSTGPGSVMYYGTILTLASILHKPSFILSQGFGPIKTDIGRLMAKSLLPCADKATLRDEESLKEFRELVPDVPAELTADPAFLLECGDLRSSQEVLSKCNIADPAAPIVAVSVRTWFGLDVAAQAEAFNIWAENFSADSMPQLLIIPLQFWYDEGISNRLSSLVKMPSTVSPQLSASEILALMAAPQVEMAAAMRLHALILGASAGKAVLGVSYDPKVERLCQRCGAPYLPLAGLTPEAYAGKLKETWENRVELSRSIGGKAADMRSSAESAFVKALELL